MSNKKIKIFLSIKSMKYFLYNKKAFMVSPGDFFKGLILGILIGAVVIYLGSIGIIPIPGL